jgi:succinate dehydrogenase hydrophobic anchor subunit
MFSVLYGFSISYLVFPYVGLPFSSADIVALVGLLPETVKYAGKAILAAPFVFHSFNGLRHLGWDMLKCECKPFAVQTSSLTFGSSHQREGHVQHRLWRAGSHSHYDCCVNVRVITEKQQMYSEHCTRLYSIIHWLCMLCVDRAPEVKHKDRGEDNPI